MQIGRGAGGVSECTVTRSKTTLISSSFLPHAHQQICPHSSSSTPSTLVAKWPSTHAHAENEARMHCVIPSRHLFFGNKHNSRTGWEVAHSTKLWKPNRQDGNKTHLLHPQFFAWTNISPFPWLNALLLSPITYWAPLFLALHHRYITQVIAVKFHLNHYQPAIGSLHLLSAFTPSVSRLIHVLLNSSNFCLHFLSGRSKSCVRHSAATMHYHQHSHDLQVPAVQAIRHTGRVCLLQYACIQAPLHCSSNQRSSVCCHLHWRFQWRRWESPQIKLAWREITGARLQHSRTLHGINLPQPTPLVCPDKSTDPPDNAPDQILEVMTHATKSHADYHCHHPLSTARSNHRHEQITEEIKEEDLNSEDEDHLPDPFVLLKYFSCLCLSPLPFTAATQYRHVTCQPKTTSTKAQNVYRRMIKLEYFILLILNTSIWYTDTAVRNWDFE